MDTSARGGDVARGIALAERAVDLTGGRSPVTLEILAFGYAEAGRFPAALGTANKAQMQARANGDEAFASSLDAFIASCAMGEPLGSPFPTPSEKSELEADETPVSPTDSAAGPTETSDKLDD